MGMGVVVLTDDVTMSFVGRSSDEEEKGGGAAISGCCIGGRGLKPGGGRRKSGGKAAPGFEDVPAAPLDIQLSAEELGE